LLSLEDGDERVAIVEFGARKYRDLEPLGARPGPISACSPISVKPISKSWAATNASPKRSGTLCRRRAARAQPRRRGFARTCGVAREAADLVRRRCGATAGRTRAVIVRVEDVLEIEDGATRAFPLHVDVPGAHNRRNLAAAFAAAWAAGVDPRASPSRRRTSLCRTAATSACRSPAARP